MTQIYIVKPPRHFFRNVLFPRMRALGADLQGSRQCGSGAVGLDGSVHGNGLWDFHGGSLPVEQPIDKPALSGV